MSIFNLTFSIFNYQLTQCVAMKNQTPAMIRICTNRHQQARRLTAPSIILVIKKIAIAGMQSVLLQVK